MFGRFESEIRTSTTLLIATKQLIAVLNSVEGIRKKALWILFHKTNNDLMTI